jgi:hypothetical protein
MGFGDYYSKFPLWLSGNILRLSMIKDIIFYLTSIIVSENVIFLVMLSTANRTLKHTVEKEKDIGC